MEQELVSIIIPTRNSSTFLERCLESVKRQTYQNIEIIVVDNNSTDDTKDIARRYTDKVFNKGPERSAQVNFGVEQSTGKYVYKVDSDFELDQEVVSQCVSEIKKGFDAIVVHNSPDVTVSWIAKIRKFEVDMYKYDITYSSARFIRKDVYQAIGGFNEKITAGEDFDFQNKLNRAGFKTGFVEAEALHLGEPTHFWRHMIKYYNYGKDFVNYKKENEEESKEQLSIGRMVYFKNWKKFLENPILGLGFVMYTLMKFGFGAAGYIHGQLRTTIQEEPIENTRAKKIILSPHFDDAVFSLGGMLASDPANCIVITIFSGTPDREANSWWDRKCGFQSSSEAMLSRSKENKKALRLLGLNENQIVDIQGLEKQYRPLDAKIDDMVANFSKEIEVLAMKNGIDMDNVDFFAPLNTHNEDHGIVQALAVSLKMHNINSSLLFYEDMPYHVRPSAIYRRRNVGTLKNKGYRIYMFNYRIWKKKLRAIREYKSQTVGFGKYVAIVVFLYSKFRAIYEKRSTYLVERVLIVD